MLEKIQAPFTHDSTTALPQEPSEDVVKELKGKYEKAGQGHVFAVYDDLTVAEKVALFGQLSTFDPHRITELADIALHPPTEDDKTDPVVEPLPEKACASILEADKVTIDMWYDAGLKSISENKVAVILMAGGQGTRLGSDAPKGCFNIGLPSEKSLFQIQAERIVRLQHLAEKQFGKDEVAVPWYVMTSGPTRKPTEEFFQKHGYFGLKKENVIIFEQGILPCISNDGKILLEDKSKVAVAPDGNGGIYQALLTSEARSDMRKRGIEHVHTYCVDNCLAKVADPVFIGFSSSHEVDIATKVVRKRDASEPVGLIIQKDGKPDVVEYSEISKEMAEATDSTRGGALKFRAANIVNHYYSFNFLESIEQWAHKLPHHVARKKIPFFDTESGKKVRPEKPNGVKLEQFVFDVFPLVGLDKFACFEVDRAEEFSPLKNARGTGQDDPDTSRKDIMGQGARWVKAAGGTVVSEKDPSEDGVEISPLVSYAGEGLEFVKGREIKAPAVLEK